MDASAGLDAGMSDGSPGSWDAGPNPTVADFYLSPQGNDQTGCGPIGSPCRTIGYVQPLVRNLAQNRPGQPVVVMLRGNAGPYWLAGDQKFGSADNGTPSTPVIWMAYPGETPVLSGGFAVSGRWASTAVDGGMLWTTTLPASTAPFEQLFINGIRHYTPRAPTSNPSGYLYNTGPVCVATQSATCLPPDKSQGNKCPNTALPYECYDRFRFAPGDVSPSWQNISVNSSTGAQHPVLIDNFEDWTVPKLRLASVDADAGIAYLTGPTATENLFHGFLAGHRYLVENVQDYLAQEGGSWFVDESTSSWLLSYFTTAGDDPNKETVVVPQQASLVSTPSPLQYVTFRGLTFSHDNLTIAPGGYPSFQAEPAIAAAVSFVDSSHVTVDSCVFANIGGFALELKGSGTQTGTGSNHVVGNTFYDTGAGGIRIGLPAARGYTDTSETANNLVQDNVVSAAGRVIAGAPLIFIGNSDNNVVQHNEVFDGYGDGISICVPNATNSCVEYGNQILYNHVHHIKLGVTSDGGGIYLFSYNVTHVSTPNVIAHNWVHDVTGDPGPGGYGGNGIYLDNDSQNATVDSNLVYRISSNAMFVNYGAGHTLTNNIFAFGKRGVVGRGGNVVSAGPLSTPAFTASKNIFYWDMNTSTKPANVSPQAGGPWDCFQSAGSSCTAQFVFSSNLYWNPTVAAPLFEVVPDSGSTTTPSVTLSSWQSQYGEDIGSSIADPAFTSPACPNDDYSFSSTQAIDAIGFVPFDYKQAGSRSGQVPPSQAAAWPLQAPANPCTYY